MEEEIKQVETISVPETPVQLPKKSNLSKIVLLFILGLIILAGAVYAGITIGKKQSPPEVIPQVVEASPTPSETANWKTYKNEVLGYILKYPSDWELNESESDGYPYVGLIDPIAQKMAPSQTEIDRGAMIEIYTAPWLGKDKSLLSLQKSLSSVEEAAPSQEQETPVKVKESTKGQITGMWKSLRTEKVSGETFAFFREYEGKTLVFRVTITVFNSKDQTQPLTDSYLTIFDQILSTFKFLE